MYSGHLISQEYNRNHILCWWLFCPPSLTTGWFVVMECNSLWATTYEWEVLNKYHAGLHTCQKHYPFSLKVYNMTDEANGSLLSMYLVTATVWLNFSLSTIATRLTAVRWFARLPLALYLQAERMNCCEIRHILFSRIPLLHHHGVKRSAGWVTWFMIEHYGKTKWCHICPAISTRFALPRLNEPPTCWCLSFQQVDKQGGFFQVRKVQNCLSLPCSGHSTAQKNRAQDPALYPT